MKTNHSLTAFAIATMLVSACAQAEDKQVPIKLDLPKAAFVGTPMPVKLPNLENAYVEPTIMVPEGTTNVAQGKKVTSSDSAPVIGELEFVTDGSKDATDGSYVELGPNTQWVQIDLGAKNKIYAVAVWHYHAQARAYRAVVIQVSDDPDFLTGVKTVYNNDCDNSAGLGIGNDKAYIETNKGRLIDTKVVEGRYVRLYSKGNTSNEMNHYIEVEVYGKPTK